VATSSLYSPMMAKYKKGENWAQLDPKLHSHIEQGMVTLKKGEFNDEATAFYNFILSSKAKKTLNAFGYSIP